MGYICVPLTATDTPTRYNEPVSARPSPAHFYLDWLKVVFFTPFGPAPVIFGALTVLGAVIALLTPDLLGELNWLLWAVPLSQRGAGRRPPHPAPRNNLPFASREDY